MDELLSYVGREQRLSRRAHGPFADPIIYPQRASHWPKLSTMIHFVPSSSARLSKIKLQVSSLSALGNLAGTSPETRKDPFSPIV